MTASFIPGKDASLEASIQKLQAQLAQLDFHIIEQSWLNPVANVWSVHIRDRDCPLLFTNGKGASQKAALASALGEFFERLSTNYFWADYYLGESIAQAAFVHYPQERWLPITDDQLPVELLNPELKAFYNPEKSLTARMLVDTNSGNSQRGICALPFTRQADGMVTWIPVNIIGNLYVSNGMSAGNTATEARTQALSEIFERSIKFRIIAEGICLPEVPAAVIARYPKIQAGIAELRAAGFGILVKDASLGGKYPVMCVTLLNPKDQGCYASFGAHPRFEVALERALTELLQGRALEKLDGFSAPDFDLEEVAATHNLETHFIDSSGLIHWDFLRADPDFEFNDWNFEGNTQEEFAHLCQQLHQDSFNIYIMDYEHLGVYSCRILVPGLSEIYTVDDLEWDNNNTGNDLRPAILNLAELDEAGCTELLDTLEDLSLDNIQPIAALIGLAPDANSLWADLRVGELKALLALAIGDQSRSLEACQWIQYFDQLPAERARTYRCVETLLQLESNEAYLAHLQLIYGASSLANAQALIKGELRFWNLASPDLSLATCVLHQSLLTAYQKVHPELK
ncbi:ribosomal protein S12 methylthiotransferase accessory factor [Thiothrix eikelboomii]|uniref:Ribosomal protein S12 methylthiotransferase accessory factor n=1 Tax=Thiothrix eikelboomii TaxID=92487 RepID=A0A1T4WD95_9GAMM|nr:30S ribosomal protein S12 methylthiotransferase accessory factor YcaO [Thiothrix eikelboomii]SKA75263.1 ribosomal protein S12 methylthiotransferase accessory factor [Thiothrix eikelboomii]